MKTPTITPAIISERWIRQRVEESKAAFIRLVIRQFPTGYTTEDRLPETISDADYNLWLQRSQVINGIRIGPLLCDLATATTPAPAPAAGSDSERSE